MDYLQCCIIFLIFINESFSYIYPLFQIYYFPYNGYYGILVEFSVLLCSVILLSIYIVMCICHPSLLFIPHFFLTITIIFYVLPLFLFVKNRECTFVAFFQILHMVYTVFICFSPYPYVSRSSLQVPPCCCKWKSCITYPSFNNNV